MYKVIQAFHDQNTMELMTVGTVVDWTDEKRIKAALDRGLIEEIKPKEEPKAMPEPKKAPAKKKK